MMMMMMILELNYNLATNSSELERIQRKFATLWYVTYLMTSATTHFKKPELD
jgi:hypothetical protein